MVTETLRFFRAGTKKHAGVVSMPDLDDVIDRLRRLVEELREASESGEWYIVEDVVEELEGVINDLWGLSIRCRCDSRGARSPETPPRKPTVLGNTVRGGGG
jgi:hypothetical protein